VEENDERKQLLKKALDLLSRRDHTARELQFKLRSRGYAGTLIEEVLVYLIDKNLLDDQRFAVSFLRMRSNKGYGERDIRSKLLEKGVGNAQIDYAFKESTIDWNTLAYDVLKKKLQGSSREELEINRERARAARFLGSRGFTSEQVRSAVFSLLSNKSESEQP